MKPRMSHMVRYVSRGLYLVRSPIICMDASGKEKSDEPQAEEKTIGIREPRTIERQESEATDEGSTENVNELPATTTKEIIGNAQQESKANIRQKCK